MFSGKLDKRITVQQFTTTTNDFGEEEKAWATLVTTWAQVLPLTSKAKEILESSSITAFDYLSFRIRHRSDLRRDHRIMYENNVYDIEAIVELGRKEGLEIIGKAVRQ